MFWKKSQKSFFDYFEDHSKEILIGSKLLQELFAEQSNVTASAKQIKECEHRADVITHQVIKQMDTANFILPLDREDILNFIKSLDDVLDEINAASEAFSEIYTLSEAPNYACQLASVIVESSTLLVLICQQIRYPSKNATHILENCVKLHYLENEGDRLKKEALHAIYSKISLNTILLPMYLAWNDIYRVLEEVTDKAEDCANIAEQIVLKYS